MSYDYSDFSNYSLKDTIGEGNFGKVKLAIFIPTKEEFAVKILNKKRLKEKMKKSIFNEIEIIKKLNHINVIYVYQIIENTDNFYIIMEYCEKGELFDYIVEKRRLSEDESSIFFYQLINGVEHIHNKKIAHRDLKPENLLLNKNKILKIIDFGLSHNIKDGNFLSTKCGSPSYASPEIIINKYYDGFKSDIWCCGIILYAMLCGYLPFEGENNDELFKNILICKPEFPNFLSENSKRLINKILNVNPDERISINDIKCEDFYLKGKELCDIDYHLVERNLLVNRIINKNQDVKKKIRNLKILYKENEENVFRKKLVMLNTNLNLKCKEKKKYNTKNILTDNIKKHDGKISFSNLSSEQTRNKNKNIFSSSSSKNNNKQKLNKVFSPKFSLRDLIETKSKKKNIPHLNNTNFIYDNINLNFNFKDFYINGKKNVKTTLSPFDKKKIHLSKRTKIINSISNNINNNNQYDSITKKTFNIIMSNMNNFKMKHKKKRSENISAISNLSNYTNPNFSNERNKSSSRDEKFISQSTRRDSINFLPILKHY